jgi:hypothetical protein
MQLRSGLAGSHLSAVPRRTPARRAPPSLRPLSLSRRTPLRRLGNPLAAAVGTSWPSNGSLSNGHIDSVDGNKGDDLDDMVQGPGAEYHPPAPLPATPTAATLAALMPYLAKLALGERQLVWRVGGALIALLV